ncbi:aspartate carbamoyltransferase regulatory subunit [Candidatus Woesearchaeota archaeon CG10_big_fil_rev_8_21_14_0_10_34_8]|nr:MAG: aspartate carbamoyltransferase regulatory subunit [Candidatus Woesearchaeota archaeon CG10_big_fil_rev_8_21_14_0_10_34_8]
MIERTLNVSAIKDGTVLDHLPSNKVLLILKLLTLQEDKFITLGINLPSKKNKKKGILKLADRALSTSELNKIAVLAPETTVNTITNYKVTNKKKIMLKKIESNTIKCSNPNCITNKERTLTKFEIIEKEPLRILCHFCEREMQKEEIQFL